MLGADQASRRSPISQADMFTDESSYCRQSLKVANQPERISMHQHISRQSQASPVQPQRQSQTQEDWNQNSANAQVITYQSPCECPIQLTINRHSGLTVSGSPTEFISTSRASSSHSHQSDSYKAHVVRLDSRNRSPGYLEASNSNTIVSPIELNETGEYGHRMVVDGDALTLVILDCSPQPEQIRSDSRARIEGVESTASNRSCGTECSGQTELILRHHHSSPSLQNQYYTTRESSTRMRIDPIEQFDNSRSYQINEVYVQDESQNRQACRPIEYQPREQHISYITNESNQRIQPVRNYIIDRDGRSDIEHTNLKQWNSQDQYNQGERRVTRSTDSQGMVENPSTSRNYQIIETKIQTEDRSIMESGLITEPEQQIQQAEMSPRPGYKLVKRWDFKTQKFIWSEVPDRINRDQSTTPSSVELQTTRSHTRDQFQTQPSTSMRSDTAVSVPSQQTDTNIIRADTEPSWLAHRIPDLASVQSDPLYQDLMLELQKLEEGVAVKPPEVVYVDPGSNERPVFRQSVIPEKATIEEYENIEFVCHLTPISDPSMKIEWLLNGKPLKESSRYTSENDFGIIKLKIRRCEAEDSGLYQCRASNALGEAVTTTSLRVKAQDSVQYESLNPSGLDKIRELENPRSVEYPEESKSSQPPKFITHITDYVEKDEGDSLHLECCLAPVDDPDLKTEWLFNGRPLVTGSRFHTIDDFGFIVLDIDWLFPRDTGEYICRATNKHGTDMTRTVLLVKPDKNIVLDSQIDNPDLADKLRQLEFPDVTHEQQVEEPEKPAHFVQQLYSENNKRQFNEGENVHFEARAAPATDGNLTVEWYHNDKPLMSGHRFRPAFDFGHIMLDILYVYPEDSGTYKCVARNLIGTDVTQFDIHVTGKPSLDYHTQLPEEMVGGVQKLTDMEAMWNRPPDPEEEEAPMERTPPQFVLKPIPYTAFEGSVARFCCRITGHPRPRLTWTLNGQTVVTGSRYKLTYDGMYHLTIPKCQMSDAGKIEVYAKNPLGDCYANTQLKVRPKVDDYRSVLKRSPNPWYDEQVLQAYRRQRLAQDNDDDDNYQRLSTPLILPTSKLTLHPSVMSYMEPGTPDVNLLTSPLVEPGDLHPSVMKQQAVKAPAPSTIKRAMTTKDDIQTSPVITFNQDEKLQSQQPKQVEATGVNLTSSSSQSNSDTISIGEAKDQQQKASTRLSNLQQQRQQQQRQQQQQQLQQRQQQQQQQIQQRQQQQQEVYEQQQQQYQDQQERYHQQLQEQQQQQQKQQQLKKQEAMRQQSQEQAKKTAIQQQQEESIDQKLPPPSPESSIRGKEVHSHTQKQTQVERRANKEIKREIIERETFEQEYKGMTKENLVRADSVERGASQTRELRGSGQVEYQQQAGKQQRQVHFQTDPILIDDNMIPPEFTQKIQPCQAIDGDEARFECNFIGEPTPSIDWFRESKMIKPSNLYSIITDLNENKSTLIIKRVTRDANAVFTVKAENAAGSAKSSANLVVEPHPLPEASRGGRARQIDAEHFSFNEMTASQQTGRSTGRSTSTISQALSRATETSEASGQTSISRSETPDQQKIIRSVRTRVLSPDDLAALIRASPEGLIAPTFLHTIHDVIVRPGELVRLDARLLGSQPMDVKWLKDGQRVRADKSHKMLLEGDIYTLLILECSSSDKGIYECLASNSVGEARCQAGLTVTDERASVPRTPEPQVSVSWEQQVSGDTARQGVPKLIKRLENQQVREGSAVTLRCQISSFPVPEVQWFKHGNQPIKPSKYFRIFKDNDETYCLRIMETFQEDQGEYRCVARAPNGRGQVETIAMVTVIPNMPK